MIFTYPLNWPPGWPKTGYQTSGGFQVDLGTAESELANELELLGATSAYISTNNEVTLNQRPKAGQRDPAAVLHFVRQGKELTIPCDKFDNLRANIRAIGLTLESIRRMERYGTNQMIDAALSGFAALPASTGGPITIPARPWHEVLGISPDASPELISAAYKVALKKAHPDAGGSPEAFHEVQRAYKEGLGDGV